MPDPFETAKGLGVTQREQVIKVTEELIAQLELHLGMVPPGTALTSAEYRRWTYLGMSYIGEIAGMLKAFELLSILPPDVAHNLKAQALVKITMLKAQIDLGSR